MPEGAPRLLVVDPDQFGYLTDTFQFCRYLRNDFEITYVGWDYGLQPIKLDGVRLIHVPRTGGKIQRMARYLQRAVTEVRTRQYGLILVEHFAMCFVVPLLCGNRRMVLDIRTGHVRGSRLGLWAKNMLLTMESLFFRNVTIISDSLRRMLRISAAKSHVLPLGADIHDIPEKKFDGMRMFYVGSLESRRIYETVQGLDRFYREYGGSVSISYDIVGFGHDEDERRLRETIAQSSCRDCITFHGRVPNTALRPFLERNNIGIAYIPIVKHYDCQPATKLFEYLLSGMAALATRTSENVAIVRPENGVLINDTAEGVYEGLKQLLGMLHAYNSSAIKTALQHYTWEAIVRDNLRAYLLKILQVYNNAHL